jgi:hypothetical protein
MSDHEKSLSGIAPWRRFYEAALFERDPATLGQLVEEAKQAIHWQIMDLYSRNQASELWEAMDALRVLDELFKRNLPSAG